MNKVVATALNHIGGSGGDGGKIINGFPVVRPGSALEKQMIKEAAEMDRINRDTRRRFFGEDCPEPVKMAPREEPESIARPRRAVSAVPAPKLPPVPTAEQQRIRAMVVEARETRGFLRRLRAAMHWDWDQFNGWLTGKIVSAPKTWAKLEKVVPHILATINEEVWQRAGRKRLSPEASDEQIVAVRDYLGTLTIPYGFWLHLRQRARVSSQAAWLVKPGNTGGNTAKRRVTVAQLERIRETVASGAVHAACATTATTRAAQMREKRAAQKKRQLLATEVQTTNV